ncbi:MAG: copper oxidase [Candidatus Nanohaloarchaea archaeon]
MVKKMLLVLTVLAILNPVSATVMNQNTDELPPGCDSISGWENITVKAGSHYAQQFNGKTFTYDDREYRFPACTKLSVTLVNNDSIRHQWMVHGLPQTTYPGGMFTIETTGGKETGTFILPAYDETLLVHCGLPQHMQKGMKAQLIVGEGDGNIANIPGITGSTDRYAYPREKSLKLGVPVFLTALFVAAATVFFYNR